MELGGCCRTFRGVGIDWGSASDQQLWSQATNELAGEAFGELFERHADRVYAHCFSRTGSWSMAEDLTSVLFLEAWRKRTARADSNARPGQGVHPVPPLVVCTWQDSTAASLFPGSKGTCVKLGLPAAARR